MAAFVFMLLSSAMVSSIFWLRLSRWVGKFYAWQTFNFVNAMTNLMFFLIGKGDSWLVIAAGALNGIPVGGQFLVNTIMADVIDYDEFLNGSRSEAAFSVFATLIPKFVAIPASAIPLAIINLLGFVGPSGSGIVQPQNSNVRTFILVAFVMLPFTCAVASFFVKFRYPIKNDIIAKGVQAGIDAYSSGATHVRPLPPLSCQLHCNTCMCEQGGGLCRRLIQSSTHKSNSGGSQRRTTSRQLSWRCSRRTSSKRTTGN